MRDVMLSQERDITKSNFDYVAWLNVGKTTYYSPTFVFDSTVYGDNLC